VSGLRLRLLVWLANRLLFDPGLIKAAKWMVPELRVPQGSVGFGLRPACAVLIAPTIPITIRPITIAVIAIAVIAIAVIAIAIGAVIGVVIRVAARTQEAVNALKG